MAEQARQNLFQLLEKDWPKFLITSLIATLFSIQANAQQETYEPDIELLEFLGGWEDEEGQVVDAVSWFDFFEEQAMITEGHEMSEADFVETKEKLSNSKPVELD